MDLYVSTTTEEKRQSIVETLSGYAKGKVDVRVFENRGRDIAPKLVGFADVYEHYDIALSLHTKKSPHGGEMLEPWRDYLYGHLLGSRAVVESIFELLKYDRIGMVFPQHFFPLRNHLKWGPNFEAAQNLLMKMGVKIEPDIYLECPSGSMFWCRTDALKPLLDLRMTYEDFPEEQGQIDGTLAHAIERAFLYSLEGAGFSWAKVVRRDLYPLPSTMIEVATPSEIGLRLGAVHRVLLGPSEK
jgi:lipopolysaccharide biosynthesis protein